MIEWLDEFYSSPETQKLLEESFAPLFAEYGAAVAAVAGAEVGVTPAVTPFIQAIASTYISNYLDSSRAQLQELLSAPDPRAAIEGRLAEWAEKRPGKVAQEATVQTSNAVTQTVYKDAGVTRKRWNARGKSCPYCRRMNGKVVGIDRPFHKEGDSIEVPDSEVAAKAAMNFTHDIGHPPQHQGCDCVIEADTTGMADRATLEDLASDVDASSAVGSKRMEELALAAGLSPSEAAQMANMAQGWNIDGMSLDGMALREAALKRGATAGDFAIHPQRNMFVNSRFATDSVPRADKLLDLSQAAVQKELGTTGTVRVYRGITYSKPLAGVPQTGSIEMALDQRPLTSWSLSRQEALNFAVGTEDRPGVGYLLEMDVPVRDVAGLAGTGLGNGQHSEIVLFGRASHVARVSQP